MSAETRTLSGHRRALRPQPIGGQGNVARDRLMSYQMHRFERGRP